MKNNTLTEKEEGWEFELPLWLLNPSTWVLFALLIIALILSLMLVNKLLIIQSANTGNYNMQTMQPSSKNH